jgi:hypothetical protein
MKNVEPVVNPKILEEAEISFYITLEIKYKILSLDFTFKKPLLYESKG